MSLDLLKKTLSALRWELVLLLLVGWWLVRRSLSLNGQKGVLLRVLGKDVLLVEIGDLNQNKSTSKDTNEKESIKSMVEKDLYTLREKEVLKRVSSFLSQLKMGDEFASKQGGKK